MRLSNEPVTVRPLLGALLGALVTFGYVQWTPEELKQLLSLGDAAMVALPTLTTLIGAIWARFAVDGPKTSAVRRTELRLQEEEIARLRHELQRQRAG